MLSALRRGSAEAAAREARLRRARLLSILVTPVASVEKFVGGRHRTGRVANFQLRTLCQRENNGQEPALKPMDMEKAQALEARGLSKTAELKKSAGKTWQSANDVDSSAMGGLGSLSAMRGPL